MNLASLIVAIAALALSALGYATTRRKASEANAAAARSADAAIRSANAAERQAELAQQEADRYEIPWELVRHAGDTWRLTNTGNEIAYNVRVQPVHASLELVDAPQDATVGPKSSVTFMAAPDMGTENFGVRVLWRRSKDHNVMDWIGQIS